MAKVPPEFTPLDPGRIYAQDPVEMAYWAKHLGCSVAVLTQLVAQHGEHVDVVREAVARQSPKASEVNK